AVLAQREGQGLAARGEVALRRAARRSGAVAGPGQLDEQVAPAGQLLEVGPGHGRVEVEALGHVGGAAALPRLADEPVNVRAGAGGGVKWAAVRAGWGGGAGSSLVLTAGSLATTGILPMPVVENPAPGEAAVPAHDPTVVTALRAVEDPVLRRSVVDLGMVAA